MLIKRRNAIGASLHQFDKMNNLIQKQLVDHLGFGLHGHCGTIFAMLNVILIHSIAFEIVEIKNVCMFNINANKHRITFLLFGNINVYRM